MRFRALALVTLSVFGLSAATGCVWISEEDIAAFNDRDGDGLDHDQDCDDSNGKVNDKVDFYKDVDGDGFGDAEGQAQQFCRGDEPSDVVDNNDDCNDNDANAKPGGVEVCDAQNIDEDCDGFADDADSEAEGKVTWYADSDGDTFGDDTDAGTLACDPPTGSEVTDATDCDDSRNDVNPDATEVCDDDNADEDCNGSADDNDSALDTNTRTQFYADSDGDGYGNPDVVGLLQCDTPGGQAPNNGDCNDADQDINPGATEVCDAADVDEDCNAMADNDDAGADTSTMSLWYPDVDGDGFGDMNAAAIQACDAEADQVADNTDCDDAAGKDYIYPGSQELCDTNVPAEDEDCDGLTNDADPDADKSDWWPDNDGDGFGADGPAASTACLPPMDHVDRPGDCNDNIPTINPDAHEYHDGVDSDCDVLASDYVCGQAYLRVGTGEAFTTIQSAVDAIDQITYCDGDTIEVLPGTYVENVTIADKAPIVRGLVGPLSTHIVGTGTDRVVSLDRTAALFEGFTITGGNATGDGGGIRVFYGNGTVVNDVIVSGNHASVNGGGIELRNPVSVTVSNSTIGGALPSPLVGNAYNDTSTGDGGGIHVSSTGGQAGGTVLLSNLSVLDNTSADEGGGIRVHMDAASAVTVAIEDSVIEGNSAITGGGISGETTPDLQLRRVDVVDNVGQANVGGVLIKNSGVLGEGMYLDGNQGVTVGALQISDYTAGPVTLRDVVAIDNIITQASGTSLMLKGDAADGSVLERVEVARTVRALGAQAWGAGLYVEGKLDATNLLIYDETGPSGLFMQEALSGTPTTHSVTNATFVGNAGDGIQIGAVVASSITLNNVISAHNDGYGVNQVLINASVSNSDVYDNAGGQFNGTNPIGTNNVITVDPSFVSFNALDSSLNWDLDLNSGSPCKNTGDAALTDADGSQSSMGYYGGPAAP